MRFNRASRIIRNGHYQGSIFPCYLVAVKAYSGQGPKRFSPLCYGQMQDGSIVFASESCALDAVNAKHSRDLLPGEIAVVENGKIHFDTSHCNLTPRSLCVFEYIYFARPDSVIDGVSVSMARQQAGRFLAKAYPVDADIVVGVPDSDLKRHSATRQNREFRIISDLQKQVYRSNLYRSRAKFKRKRR